MTKEQRLTLDIINNAYSSQRKRKVKLITDSGIFYTDKKEMPESISITKIKIQKHGKRPPKPYNLFELQKDANEKYNYTAVQTQRVAESLYKKSFITNPLTEEHNISVINNDINDKNDKEENILDLISSRIKDSKGGILRYERIEVSCSDNCSAVGMRGDQRYKDNTDLFDLEEGDVITVLSSEVIEEDNICTESSLLSAMRNYGAKIENGCVIRTDGIGTYLTRAKIIQSLADDGYIYREGNKITPVILSCPWCGNTLNRTDPLNDIITFSCPSCTFSLSNNEKLIQTAVGTNATAKQLITLIKKGKVELTCKRREGTETYKQSFSFIRCKGKAVVCYAPDKNVKIYKGKS